MNYKENLNIIIEKYQNMIISLAKCELEKVRLAVEAENNKMKIYPLLSEPEESYGKNKDCYVVNALEVAKARLGNFEDQLMVLWSMMCEEMAADKIVKLPNDMNLPD